MADEFRIKVEREAFEKSGDLPAGFQWDPLDFGWNKNLEAYMESLAAAVAAAEEEEAATVHKKFSDANQIEMRNEQNFDRQSNRKKSDLKNSSKNAQKGQKKSQENFDVGVWDPSLADHLINTPINEIIPVGADPFGAIPIGAVPVREAPAVIGWAGPPKTAGLDVIYQPPSVANLNKTEIGSGLQNGTGAKNNEVRF